MELNLQFFGGRGSSSAGGSGGGNGSGGEFHLPDGSVIEYDGDLKFGKKDKNIPSSARKQIESWEEKRVKMKVEYAFAVDENGNAIGKEVKGGKNSVRTPSYYHDTPNGTFTHIHPREEGVLGGTFSEGDLRNFVNSKGKTTRAAAKEGTYSISKNSNFDSAGFKQFISKNEDAANKKYKENAKKIRTQYLNGSIDFAQYDKSSAKAFNTLLVDLHNGLLAGQKQYGYTYTLEKR